MHALDEASAAPRPRLKNIHGSFVDGVIFDSTTLERSSACPSLVIAVTMNPFPTQCSHTDAAAGSSRSRGMPIRRTLSLLARFAGLITHLATIRGPAGLQQIQLHVLEGHKEAYVLAINLRKPLKFDKVNPPFSKFTFRDIGMGFSQPPSDLHLSQSRAFTSRHKSLREVFISSLISVVPWIHAVRYSQSLTSSPK